MPDEDLSNLPILDDIIEPGDAEKARHSSSSKEQRSSAQTNRDSTSTSTTSDSGTVMETDQIEQDSTETAADVRAGPSDPSAANRSEQDSPAEPDGSLDQPLSHSPPYTDQAVEALTETILSSLLPELEQLLRIKIRQSLQHDLNEEHVED